MWDILYLLQFIVVIIKFYYFVDGNEVNGGNSEVNVIVIFFKYI